MREKEYVNWLRGTLSSGYVGDDAAAVDINGSEAVFTTDLLVAGTHFRADTPPRLVGRKAAAVSLSDIAAMGASPVCAVLSVCFLRGCGEEFSKEVLLGARGIANEFGLEIVGGDTTSSDECSCIACSAVGRSPKGGAVRRSGAREGDVILATGTLGGSLLGGHLQFVPRVREAEKILSLARPSAMIDVSDGLACDIGHILEESGVGAVIVEKDIPVSNDAGELSKDDGRSALEHALHDGEDYELVMTVSEKDAEKILGAGLDCGVTSIGKITAGAGLRIRNESGVERDVETAGYEHEW
jgi:thiamine-monophosphate kinase